MVKMPAFVANLFWENDNFDSRENASYVITRILEMGDDRQVGWMFENYDRKKMIEVFKKSKNLSCKSANYWSDYFGVDKKEVLCLKKQLPSKQNRFC